VKIDQIKKNMNSQDQVTLRTRLYLINKNMMDITEQRSQITNIDPLFGIVQERANSFAVLDPRKDVFCKLREFHLHHDVFVRKYKG
jgi:hypothetical protein